MSYYNPPEEGPADPPAESVKSIQMHENDIRLYDPEEFLKTCPSHSESGSAYKRFHYHETMQPFQLSENPYERHSNQGS